MEVIDKERENFESVFKEKYYIGIIQAQHNNYREHVCDIQALMRDFGITTPLPSAWITVNNKSIELAHIFKSKGISIYSSKKSEGTKNLVTTNILGEALLIDVAKKANIAGKDLVELKKVVIEQAQEKRTKYGYLENHDKKSKFMQRKNIKRLNSSIQDYHELESNAVSKIVPCINSYIQSDADIFNYSLNEKNIINAVITLLSTRNYQSSTISSFKNCIYKDLDILGLEYVINSLDSEISRIINLIDRKDNDER